MSEVYKTHSDGLYFVSLSVMGWVDVFIRRSYQEILINSIHYCQQHKNLKIYCYCIMSSHVHFITSSENGNLSTTLRDFKSFTAKQLLNAIAENPQESRKEWLLKLLEISAKQPQQISLNRPQEIGPNKPTIFDIILLFFLAKIYRF